MTPQLPSKQYCLIILIGLLPLFSPCVSLAQCSDLIISEYIEGSSWSKGFELYNISNGPVNLNDYTINRYNNGSNTPNGTMNPQGTVQSGDVFVITAPLAAAQLVAAADTLHQTIVSFNGDDAIELVHNPTNTAIDVIGEVGVDPGHGWPAGVNGMTYNTTIVRKLDITTGNYGGTWAPLDWIDFPNNYFDSIGMANHTGVCVPLPVSLSYFAGFLKENKVSLEWTTDMEINNKGFEILNSQNRRDWQIIDFVEGKGNSLEPRNYHFVDENPTYGANYYRIKQIDYGGAFELSKIVVLISQKNKPQIRIYPNPTFNLLHVDLELEEETTIEVKNNLGRTILKEKGFSSEFQIDVTGWGPGNYYLTIKSGFKTWEEKIVKLY